MVNRSSKKEPEDGHYNDFPLYMILLSVICSQLE